VTAHSSWAQPRSSSYERLAFVGDSLLSQILTLHLDSTSSAEVSPGDLTRIRGRVVSDETLKEIAKEISLDRIAVEQAPDDRKSQAAALVETGKPLASMLEASIAACWRHHGAQLTSEAVSESFEGQIKLAMAEPSDFKSLLQELLARSAATVRYEVGKPLGPPHAPTFEVTAVRDPGGQQLGRGTGSSKKAAETAAAKAALDLLQATGVSDEA
jgi:ribonuclease-3